MVNLASNIGIEGIQKVESDVWKCHITSLTSTTMQRRDSHLVVRCEPTLIHVFMEQSSTLRLWFIIHPGTSIITVTFWPLQYWHWIACPWPICHRKHIWLHSVTVFENRLRSPPPPNWRVYKCCRQSVLACVLCLFRYITLLHTRPDETTASATYMIYKLY